MVEQKFTKNNPQFSKYGQGQAALIGFGLGACVGVGLLVAVLVPSVRLFGAFMVAWSVFHLWEFLFVAIFHPGQLTTDSFLLNHSKEFQLALAAAVCEYWVEWALGWSWKQPSAAVFAAALCLVVAGQTVRTLAMVTAARSFTHQIAETKVPQHRLVTHGIYRLCRHPSYFGWFYWSVGTQLLLMNPVCTVGYAWASWRFFDHRIRYEERTLVDLFGQQYRDYAKTVGTLIPFIK